MKLFMKTILLLIVLCVAGTELRAQAVPAGDYGTFARTCIAGLEAMDPAYAVKCSSDKEFLAYVRSQKPNMEAWLVSRAKAINDMVQLTGVEAVRLSTPALSEALEGRLTKKPYTNMGAPGHAGIGFGPEPEKTVAWFNKYQAGILVFKKNAEVREKILIALRDYDALSRIETAPGMDFKPRSVASQIDDYVKNAVSKNPGFEGTAKQWWLSLDLKARRALLAGIAREQMLKLGERGGLSAYDVFKGHWGWDFLRREDMPVMQNYLRNFKNMAALREKISLTYEQEEVDKLLGKIEKMSPRERENFLNTMFEGENRNELDEWDAPAAAKAVTGKTKGGESYPGAQDKRPIKEVVNAALVNSAVSYNIERSVSPEQNEAIVSALKTRMPDEMSGTRTGDKVLEFYKTNPVSLRMEQGSGYYAKYEVAPEASSSGEIVINTGLVQQYMEQNNITTKQLLSEPAYLNGLAKYVAPVFVHEATHQMQHAATSGKMADPYVRGDELESAGTEALFTAEKLRKDKAFAAIMRKAQETSPYARQTLANADTLARNPLEFRHAIEAQDYAHLPDIDAASAQILAIADDELRARDCLACDKLADIERTGLDMTVVSRVSVEELGEIAPQVKTAVLEQVRAEFLKADNIHAVRGRESARELMPAAKSVKGRSLGSYVPSFK